MDIHVDHIGDLAIVECQGRIFPNEAAFRLRDAVMSQAQAAGIVLDLSQVYTMDRGILFMLLRLQRWAGEHHVELKLFNPTSFVRATFDENGFSGEFQIADSVDQIFAVRARSAHLPVAVHAA